MGRLPRNPPTPQRQVGTIYPGPRDEPGRQGRDSSRDLLIAPGILMRLVPGSPAIFYLGSCSPALKLVGAFLKHLRKTFERGGERFHVLATRTGWGG